MNISPNISSWEEGRDPLADYLDSLDKVYGFDVELVLPGHRRVFADFRGRIDELKQHHKVRAEEVLAVLDGEDKTAYEVASEMTWDFKADSWDQIPVMQKWFATGEAIAHLEYLKERGRAHRQLHNGRVMFSAA